jgi:hypothetical protein
MLYTEPSFVIPGRAEGANPDYVWIPDRRFAPPGMTIARRNP